MDDEERLEGEEDMELDDASDGIGGGDDDDEEATGIPVSPANSDQFLVVPVNSSSNGKKNKKYLHYIIWNKIIKYIFYFNSYSG